MATAGTDSVVHRFNEGDLGDAIQQGDVAGTKETKIESSETLDKPDIEGKKEDLTGSKDVQNEELNQGVKEFEVKSEPRKLTWRDRLAFWKTVFTVYVLLITLFMGAVSIYWGSFYKRESRYKNMTTLLVNLDSPVDINGTAVAGFGDAFYDMVKNNQWVQENFGFDTLNSSDVTQEDDIQGFVHAKITHEKYWGGIIISSNSTARLYEALINGNASAAGDIPLYISYLQEQTRHLAGFSSYYAKNANQLESIWINNYSYRVYNQLLSSLTNDTRVEVARNNDTLKLLTVKPTLNVVTIGVTPVSAALGPSQLGLIYAQLFTIYQFSFFQKIYAFIKPKVGFRRYCFLRWMATNVNSMVLSLVYSLATIAFRVPVTLTFGHSGFLVLWMVMFLFILANSLVNETVFAIALSYNIPWLIAPFTILNVILNLSTSFFPLAVSPKFFRFGYALPMHNTYELIKVVFFDTWKGHMGVNFTVMIAWVIIGSVSSISVLFLTRRRERKHEAF